MDEVAALVDKQRNPYLTVERMSEQFDKALRVAALASVHEDFSMSSADLDELRRARETALERTTHTFDMLIRMTETRRRNLVAYQHLNLVSLGLDWKIPLSERFYLRPGFGLAYTDGAAGLPIETES